LCTSKNILSTTKNYCNTKFSVGFSKFERKGEKKKSSAQIFRLKSKDCIDVSNPKLITSLLQQPISNQKLTASLLRQSISNPKLTASL